MSIHSYVVYFCSCQSTRVVKGKYTKVESQRSEIILNYSNFILTSFKVLTYVSISPDELIGKTELRGTSVQ